MRIKRPILDLTGSPPNQIKQMQTLHERVAKYSTQERTTYLIYGSHKAIALFRESPETLMASNNLDYHIGQYGVREQNDELLEGVFPLQTARIIDEETCKRLHVNLCSKVYPYLKMKHEQERRRSIAYEKRYGKN